MRLKMRHHILIRHILNHHRPHRHAHTHPIQVTPLHPSHTSACRPARKRRRIRVKVALHGLKAAVAHLVQAGGQVPRDVLGDGGDFLANGGGGRAGGGAREGGGGHGLAGREGDPARAEGEGGGGVVRVGVAHACAKD